jgi:hypothetical protein
MSIFDIFKKSKKEKYIVDKTPVDSEYIESKFRFLVDCGYKHVFYQKNWEREFVYTANECRVEIYLDGYVFDCVIRTKDVERVNLLESPLVDEGFVSRYLKASNHERADMIADILRERADIFLQK